MILTFDVETRGLYGQAFAVGFVLTTDNGRQLTTGLYSCPYEDVEVAAQIDKVEENDDWLEKNVLPHLPPPNCFTAFGMRSNFMAEIMSMRRMAEKQAEQLLFVADVAYPCETRFLAECWRDNPVKFGPYMPYPLIDLSAMLLAKGYDPVGTYSRRDNEKPPHNPLNDALQSSRIYHQLMRGEAIE